MASSKSPNTQPKRVKVDRRKALLIAKKKKECIARAQKIVEEFIDGSNDETYFLQQLRWINQDHYQDIIEERSIIKYCGYPLCSQPLLNIPKQKYHISTTQNKVYDITERKNFCSSGCYKASLYLKNQLFTSPLWLRDKEPIPSFTLFHQSMQFNIEEINLGIQNIEISKDDSNEDCRDSNHHSDCSEVDSDDHDVHTQDHSNVTKSSCKKDQRNSDTMNLSDEEYDYED